MKLKSVKTQLVEQANGRIQLHSPTEMPQAGSFLWNKKLLVHVNCRGFATAQFMQPEPAKYTHPPNLEAKTFMQPEQAYFAHHPGRFFYIKDEETGQFFSAPFEPVRGKLDHFTFDIGQNDIQWRIQHLELKVHLQLQLADEDPLELWRISVTNLSLVPRQISVYPYFPVGNMSWMNQSASWNPELNALVCHSISPYQKLEDYPVQKHFKDKTFLLADQCPSAWEANQSHFEGQGGLHNPDGLKTELLLCGDARYENPACILQYRKELSSEESTSLNFIFGPAETEQEIREIRARFGSPKFQPKPKFNTISVKSPDSHFDAFCNQWLVRQVTSHGELNRLTTDPQTRNYLQDHLGMCYIQPSMARAAITRALSQQKSDGSMPDGILLHEKAELKYINQIPHSDHCVWLPLLLDAYLSETADYALLEEGIPFADSQESAPLSDHINRAMNWLLQRRDPRGLSYIEQGDWCDPMNMVGPKGKGVSGWLTLASAYALKTWARILQTQNQPFQPFSEEAESCVKAVNRYLWDGHWYARGITDQGRIFGTAEDNEGKIFLNPQAWALLAETVPQEKQKSLIEVVNQHLETPFGPALLDPPFTHIHVDIGRVTQKHPGTAENGSIYNHASAFWIFALYKIGEADTAWRYLRKMLPGPDPEDYVQRGQLPNFIPNYYRGAYKRYPRTAGRSSQLFNTGTGAWILRCVVEGLFGLSGTPKGLMFKPNLPSHWEQATFQRQFRGATFQVNYQRANSNAVEVDGEPLAGNELTNIESGKTYDVSVYLKEVT